MEFFRNPEVKKMTAICIAVTAVLALTGFILSVEAGIMTLVSCIVIIAIALIFTSSRYRKLSELSDMVDKILHDEVSVDLSQYKEGELAVLSSEIAKVTAKLAEQNDALKKEKTKLTDSIADISHQLKAPLTSINLIISLLRNPDITYEKRVELTRSLERLTSKIEWLVSSLLKMSKIDAGTVKFRKDELNLSEILKKSAEPLIISAEIHNCTIEVDCDNAITFASDSLWTQEALTNIIKNCTEHVPDGGKVAITGKSTALYTEITVSDNGKGIDKDDLPHLFERFFKGKNSSDNSVGIGLALARSIVTNQNGTIKAENGRNGGAVFTVKFYNGTI